jgi:hypothetical protein
MMQETWIFNKDPQGTVWIKDNVQKSAGFEWDIVPYAFDSATPIPNKIPINQYKQVSAKDMASAVYPVTIDPTEVYITSASDGSVSCNNVNYNTARTAAVGGVDSTSLYVGQITGYTIWRDALYFDTSALPDVAVVTAANVSVYGKTDTSVNDFSLTIVSGMPTYPSDPLVPADYDRTKYNTSITGAAGFNTSGFVIGFNNISMNATGISWINVAGTTKFLLISSRDWAGAVPVANEYVILEDYAKGAGYRAYIEVIYTSGSVPTVTTNPATYITKTTARMNGYLNADGGSACNLSFNYSLWNGSAWGANISTANQSGKVTGESFYADLTGLNNSSTYRFIALAGNNLGLSQGLWVNFSTSAVGYEPSNFACSADSNSIYLSWIRNQSSEVYIRYKIGSYPTGSTDGNIVVNQSGNSYTHTGLTSGTVYYYRAWGMDGVVLSTNNSTTTCVTLAGTTTSTPVPFPSPNTSGYDTTPNGSALTDNPLYTLGNQEAAAISVPQGTWWMLVGLGILIVTGLFIFTRSRNLLLALGAMIIAGVVMAQMGMFPIWIMYVFGLSGIGMSWKELR